MTSLIVPTPKPFHRIDFSNIPISTVLEQPNFEQILVELKANFLSLIPVEQQAYFAAALQLESEPLVIQLEACAYRELHLYSQLIYGLKALLLSDATGTQLDKLAANPPWGIERLPNESDERFRTRILLSIASASSAGSRDDYRFYSLSADPALFDCEVYSPTPGVIHLYLLADNDTAPAEMVANVERVVTSEEVAPFDEVLVKPADMIDFSIDAKLWLFDGPDADVVLSYAKTQLNALLKMMFRFGYDMPRSAIESALHVGGVQRVELINWQYVEVLAYQAARCINTKVEVVGRAE